MADLLRKYKSLYSSTSNSFGTGTGETITPASVTGLPTGTEITLTFDRVDSSGTATPSKMERIIGSISGGNFVITTRGADGSTEQAHTSPVVEMIWNAKDWNDTLDAFLVGHTQAGAHSSDIVTLSGSQSLSNKTFADETEFSDDIDIATTKNIKYASSDPSRTIWASSWKPTTTAGCAGSITVEAGTNDIDYDVLDFDKDTDEHAFINWQMPDSWGGGTLLFRYIWTCTGSGAGETVSFTLKGRAYANDDAIDQAQGTGVTVADTVIADGDVHISAWSAAVTLAGSPAGGQLVHLDIMRDVSEDDLAGDARLLGVQVKYVQTVFGD